MGTAKRADAYSVADILIMLWGYALVGRTTPCMSGWLRNSITASTGRSELGNNGNEKSTTDFIAVSFFLCGHCGMRSLHAGKKYPLAVPGRSRRGRLVFEIRLHTYDNPSFFIWIVSIVHIRYSVYMLQDKTRRSSTCYHMPYSFEPRHLCQCGLQRCHVSSGSGPRHPVKVGSDAITCPVAPDHTTLLRWAPMLPRVQWLRTSPPG
jgi:hypothetical protein